MGHPSVHSLIGLLACMAGLASCSQDAGSLLILQPDPNLGSDREVAQQLATLEIVLDAVGGFEAVSDQQTSAGDFTTQNVDADPEPELVVHLNVGDRQDLPRIWLSPGSNSRKEIAVVCRGLDTQDQLAAYGGISPRRLFADDELLEVSVPFNLVRSHRKPTIVAVTPQAMPAGIYLGSIGFFASTSLDQATLADHVRVRLTTGSQSEVDVPGSLSGPRQCPFLTEMWTFTPSGCHRLGTSTCSLRLVIDPQATDGQGRPIQDPDGEPGFEKVLDCAGIEGLGDCPPAKNCSAADVGMSMELTCHPQTGMVHAATCTIGPEGCNNPTDAFDWLVVDNPDTCADYRPDSVGVDEYCVVENPWPCRRDQDCQFVGTGICDTASELCNPEPCPDCSGEAWQCLSGQGCLPRLGGCTSDCGAFGGCPDRSQTCTLLENGKQVCR